MLVLLKKSEAKSLRTLRKAIVSVDLLMEVRSNPINKLSYLSIIEPTERAESVVQLSRRLDSVTLCTIPSFEYRT
jgi:hypothetical protein